MDEIDKEIEAREKRDAKALREKREREIARGRHAKELLDDWLLIEVFDQIQTECMRILREFPIEKPEMAVQARQKLDASDTVRALLKTIVTSGTLDSMQMAAEDAAVVEDDDDE